MSVRLMYDSTRAQDIPSTAAMVAGYIDGAWAWSAADWRGFPNATKVRIATQPGTDDGDVLDVELGDATPAQSLPWARARIAAGIAVPTIYCGRSAVPAVRAVLAGIPHSLWIADWTGSPHMVDGASAVQYANGAQAGGHFDLSAVYDDAWPWRPSPPLTGGDLVGWMDPGPANQAGWLIARRVKVHEWCHIPGSNTPPSQLTPAVMDSLLALWVQSGAEAVFAKLLNA